MFEVFGCGYFQSFPDRRKYNFFIWNCELNLADAIIDMIFI